MDKPVIELPFLFDELESNQYRSTHQRAGRRARIQQLAIEAIEQDCDEETSEQLLSQHYLWNRWSKQHSRPR